MDLAERIASEQSLSTAVVRRIIELLDAQSTIPFIAHYRREDTGGLSAGRIARVADRHRAWKELVSRRDAVAQSIEEQGKLTDELRAAIEAVDNRQDLEDLFQPFRPKPATRAQKAAESGLAPLADLIWEQGAEERPLADVAAPFIDAAKDVADEDAAWSGARAICAERIAGMPALRGALRRLAYDTGHVASRLAEGVDDRAAAKYREFFNWNTLAQGAAVKDVMILRRGEKEGLLSIHIVVEREAALAECRKAVIRNVESPFLDQLEIAIEDAYDRLLAPAIEGDVRMKLREVSDAEAIDLIAANLRDLLLEPPFGPKVVLAVATHADRGFTAAVVDGAGKLVEVVALDQAGATLVPDAEVALARMIDTHKPEGIAIAKTPGAQAVRSAVETIVANMGLSGVTIVAVPEAEAAVYSTSPVGRDDMPDLEQHHRRAVSLARRLQDPLAELVKIDPRSIGSSPYHHDVDRTALLDRLLRVTTLCVCSVGVDLNTAHYRPISFVAGVGPVLAKNIVVFREQNTGFRTRSALHQVKKMTPTSFEQCAPYLRVVGENPLDVTAIHPERYPIVEKMAEDLGVDLATLLADPAARARIDISKYLDENVGEPTLTHIREQLEHPWPDPRGAFRPPVTNEGVRALEDLQVGKKLTGVIANVTDYGAFVDIGLLQDGLVHMSQLTHRRINHPQDVVCIGQVVDVVVTEVDAKRRRISLSIRAAEPKPERPAKRPAPAQVHGEGAPRPPREPRPNGPEGADGEVRLDGPPRGDGRPRRSDDHPPRRDEGGRPERRDRRDDRDWKGGRDQADARGPDGRGSRDRGPRDGGTRQPSRREPDGWRPFANLVIVDGKIVMKEDDAKKK